MAIEILRIKALGEEFIRTKDAVALIVEVANDIDRYLKAGLPLECYEEDIGAKLQKLAYDVEGLVMKV